MIYMKRILFFGVFFLTLNLSGQNLTKKVGEIEVQLIRHNYIKNSDYELTNKKSNRRNRPYLKLYFNSNGILLKSISFGKHHNTDLRLVDKINFFNYQEGKLIESIQYESDYEKNIYPFWKVNYDYNLKEQLIKEATYYYDTDSLFSKIDYEYDINLNKSKTIFQLSHYYEREFDSLNRMISLKQIFDNKLRWNWNYSYSKNERIGVFQTFYNDDINYSKREIQIFNNQDLLIEREEIHVIKNGIDSKTKIYYDKNWVIKKIEFYEKFSSEEVYKMISYFEIKIKNKSKIDFQIAKNINDQINVD